MLSCDCITREHIKKQPHEIRAATRQLSCVYLRVVGNAAKCSAIGKRKNKVERSVQFDKLEKNVEKKER